MSINSPLTPWSHQRLRLLVLLWVTRLLLLWFVLYPIYRPLSASPLLRSSTADYTLFARGGEELLAFLELHATGFADLSTALCFRFFVAVGFALALSTTVWVAIADRHAKLDRLLWRRAVEVLPAYTLLTAIPLILAAALVWVWLRGFPILGALLVASLGERRTDLVQLVLIAFLFGILATMWLLADATRAAILFAPKPPFVALSVASRCCRSHLGRIALQALLRFSLALSLHLLNCWAIANNNWLAATGLHCWLALATTEGAALSSIWLRLGWIRWISDVVRGHAALSTECPR